MRHVRTTRVLLVAAVALIAAAGCTAAWQTWGPGGVDAGAQCSGPEDMAEDCRRFTRGASAWGTGELIPADYCCRGEDVMCSIPTTQVGATCGCATGNAVPGPYGWVPEMIGGTACEG